MRVQIPLDEEETGPRAIFADPEQTIYLADMTGDGLSDIVRIRNGEVCYWPNRGYGRFGAKVTMDGAPWFDEPDLFDQRRIRLADTDGSGTTDILYLGRDGVQIYLNLAGNALSAARRVAEFPAIDNAIAVDVADLLGRGTACLVWSSPLPREAGRQMRYIDLMCGRKPHLLARIEQQHGREDADRLRVVHRVLSGGQAGGHALGHAAAVSGACRAAGRDPRRGQPQPHRHALQLSSRLLRRPGARVPRLRPGRPTRHRGYRRRSQPADGAPATTGASRRPTCRRC